LFVLPSQPVALTSGTPVTIGGVTLQMPRAMVARSMRQPGLIEDVYTYAISVTK
jgi:hypothetical protein